MSSLNSTGSLNLPALGRPASGCFVATEGFTANVTVAFTEPITVTTFTRRPCPEAPNLRGGASSQLPSGKTRCSRRVGGLGFGSKATSGQQRPQPWDTGVAAGETASPIPATHWAARLEPKSQKREQRTELCWKLPQTLLLPRELRLCGSLSPGAASISGPQLCPGGPSCPRVPASRGWGHAGCVFKAPNQE